MNRTAINFDILEYVYIVKWGGNKYQLNEFLSKLSSIEWLVLADIKYDVSDSVDYFPRLHNLALFDCLNSREWLTKCGSNYII